jgi:hypothetical protein
MRAGQDDQTTIGTMNMLHCRPRTNDTFGRSKRKIVQILMQWMTGCLRAWIRWFIDQLEMLDRARDVIISLIYHCMHGHDVWPCETLDVLNDFRQTTVLKKFFIHHEVLNFSDGTFTIGEFRFGDGNIFHHSHACACIAIGADFLKSFPGTRASK